MILQLRWKTICNSFFELQCFSTKFTLMHTSVANENNNGCSAATTLDLSRRREISNFPGSILFMVIRLLACAIVLKK